ncbi:hypothetical protein HW555_004793 [Spodoptera exigua]|uniref:Uncharacterized protein n=1 Tax=Spodoptera exigua TaxID=7107 RepID=A0A835GLR1_SPOEX|nr:hypothetical protein HW555_004793 [Spodoptera exigua]
MGRLRLQAAVLALVACAHAQYQDERAPRYIASEPKAPPTTPVPILKQINSKPPTSPGFQYRSVFLDHLNLLGDELQDAYVD